ncbi:Phox homologous domain [Pseudocohnilembus persalinus]|uniref:Phox homologous domain n=1 Tax=Pseudocohnilembus persalinus TaxID=266149 RepID=A0A0V0QZV4_PSEPJ|nr:Phox homologous domain [Pseudocohnilembus persalinus]|eukprot:KRX07827.1 Phox homologous domain [Pseudocohnilembus persalinus]
MEAKQKGKLLLTQKENQFYTQIYSNIQQNMASILQNKEKCLDFLKIKGKITHEQAGEIYDKSIEIHKPHEDQLDKKSFFIILKLLALTQNNQQLSQFKSLADLPLTQLPVFASSNKKKNQKNQSKKSEQDQEQQKQNEEDKQESEQKQNNQDSLQSSDEKKNKSDQKKKGQEEKKEKEQQKYQQNQDQDQDQEQNGEQDKNQHEEEKKDQKENLQKKLSYNEKEQDQSEESDNQEQNSENSQKEKQKKKKKKSDKSQNKDDSQKNNSQIKNQNEKNNNENGIEDEKQTENVQKLEKNESQKRPRVVTFGGESDFKQNSKQENEEQQQVQNTEHFFGNLSVKLDDIGLKDVNRHYNQNNFYRKYESIIIVGHEDKKDSMFSKSYVSYTIKTKLTNRNNQYVVQKRYSDFEKLDQYFKQSEQYQGIFIPQIPPKNYMNQISSMVGGEDPQFIEQRKIDLQIYLQNISEHEMLQNDRILEGFLIEENFQTPESYGKSLYKNFESLFSNLAHSNFQDIKDKSQAYLKVKWDQLMSNNEEQKIQELGEIYDLMKQLRQYEKLLEKCKQYIESQLKSEEKQLKKLHKLTEILPHSTDIQELSEFKQSLLGYQEMLNYDKKGSNSQKIWSIQDLQIYIKKQLSCVYGINHQYEKLIHLLQEVSYYEELGNQKLTSGNDSISQQDINKQKAKIIEHKNQVKSAFSKDLQEFIKNTEENIEKTLQKMREADSKQEEQLEKLQIERQKFLLSIDPQDRDEDEINEIMEYMGELNFFKQYSQKPEFYNLCQNLYLSSYESKQVIFSQGDSGDSAYVVLQGEVVIYIDEPTEYRGYMTLKEKARLGRGIIFGQLALKNDQKRTATAQTSEETDLIVIEKSVFNEYFKDDMETKQQITPHLKKLKLFLESLDMFALMPNHLIDNLATKCDIKKFPSNTIILKQGNDAAALYFVKQGKLSAVRLVPFKINPQTGKKIQGDSNDPSELDIRRGLYVNEYIEIDEIGSQEVFGDYSLFYQSEMDHSVITSIPCELVLPLLKLAHNQVPLNTLDIKTSDSNLYFEVLKNEEISQQLRMKKKVKASALPIKMIM